jgi:hypothetical protein
LNDLHTRISAQTHRACRKQPGINVGPHEPSVRVNLPQSTEGMAFAATEIENVQFAVTRQIDKSVKGVCGTELDKPASICRTSDGASHRHMAHSGTSLAQKYQRPKSAATRERDLGYQTRAIARPLS